MHFLTLLRHGESEGNSKDVLQGQADYELSAVGIEQAQRLASFWKAGGASFDMIISSPLRRASQTSEIVASYLTASIEYDPLWKERNFGQLQGIPFNEIRQRHPSVDFFHPYEPVGVNGESRLDLYLRASQALQNILRRPPGSYLVVSHGGILNSALFVIIGITPQGHYHSPIFHFGNAGYAQFRYNADTRQWAVLCLNNTIKSSEGSELWNID